MKELAKRGIKVGYTPDVLTDAGMDSAPPIIVKGELK